MAKPKEDPARVAYLEEARREHTKRMLETIDKGYTITGLRMCDPKKPENGMVVTLDKDEAVPVVAAIKKALAARAKAK